MLGRLEVHPRRFGNGAMGSSGIASTPAPEVSPPQTPPRRTRPPNILEACSQKWPALNLAAEAELASAILRDRPSSRLRVITWNVWFDSLCAHDRQLALMRELLSAAPDVVCLQEVLPGFLHALRGCEALKSVYEISPQDVGAYGCVILARHDLQPSFIEQRLPTNMGRTLLSAECGAGGRCGGLVVMTTHLESLNNRGWRREQLEIAAKTLAGCPAAVLCGDFNFDDTKTWGDWRRKAPANGPTELENEVLKELLPDFSDTWRTVWPEDPGYTMDGEENGVCVPDSQVRSQSSYKRERRGQKHTGGYVT